MLWVGRDLPDAGSSMVIRSALQVQVAGATKATETPSDVVLNSHSRPLRSPELARPLHRESDVQSVVPVVESSPETVASSNPTTTSSAAPDAAPGMPVGKPISGPVAHQPGPDAGGLRQYRLALGVQAGRFKRYPSSARAAGREGRVVLLLAVAQAGGAVRVSLARSSGHDALDEAALEMMRLAAARTPLPESLLGQSLAFELPVDYSLRDD